MMVLSARTDLIGDLRHKMYHLHFTFTIHDLMEDQRFEDRFILDWAPKRRNMVYTFIICETFAWCSLWIFHDRSEEFRLEEIELLKFLGILGQSGREEQFLKLKIIIFSI